MPDHVYGAFSDLEVEHPFAGVTRRAFSSASSTVTSYTFEPGGTFPIHKHAAEQITMVLEGAVHLTVAGEVNTLHPGEWSVVRGEVEHGITAGEDGARFLAIVSPRRGSSDEYDVVGGE